jgi:hypothetical protein
MYSYRSFVLSHSQPVLGVLCPLGEVIEIVDSFRPLFVFSNVSPNMDAEGEAGNMKSDLSP